MTFAAFRDSVNEREEQSKQLQEEMEEAKLRMEVSFGLKCSQILTKYVYHDEVT